MPHPPQCVSDVVVSVSHPLPALRSQSPKPMRHDSMPHEPPTQVGVPLATAQVLPQAPQLPVLDCVSMHPPLQHVRPEGQACPALHPSTHALLMQSCPRGQCVSAVQGTQACVAALQ